MPSLLPDLSLTLLIPQPPLASLYPSTDANDLAAEMITEHQQLQALPALPLDHFPSSLRVNEAELGTKTRNGSALLIFVLPSIFAEQPCLLCRPASFQQPAL